MNEIEKKRLESGESPQSSLISLLFIYLFYFSQSNHLAKDKRKFCVDAFFFRRVIPSFLFINNTCFIVTETTDIRRR